MMISDNLAPLFAKDQPGVRFRQGTVLTWNSNTGENTIDLAGGTLTNVPVLNTSEATALKAGHVVGLLGQGSAWFIIGRVTPPNDANFAGASVAFDGAYAFEQGFAQPSTPTVQATAEIDVPTWADEAAVICISTCTLVNSTAGRSEGTLWVNVDGVHGSAMSTGIAPDSGGYGIGSLTAVTTRVLTGLASTIALECVIDGAHAFSANGINTATINAMAIFRSTI